MPDRNYFVVLDVRHYRFQAVPEQQHRNYLGTWFGYPWLSGEGAGLLYGGPLNFPHSFQQQMQI